MSYRYDEDSKVYSLEDVIRHRMKYAAEEGDYDEAGFRQFLAEIGALYPQWKKVKLCVYSVGTFRWNEDEMSNPLIALYVKWRREGKKFPAIVVVPEEPLPIDGNHRVRAAQIVGDEEIEAFVPVIEGGS